MLIVGVRGCPLGLPETIDHLGRLGHAPPTEPGRARRRRGRDAELRRSSGPFEADRVKAAEKPMDVVSCVV